MVALVKKPKPIAEKAKNAGISLYPHEIATMRDRSRLRDNGVPSAYMRRLITSDAATLPEYYAPDVIQVLARAYVGVESREFEAALMGCDQPRLLARLLREAAECIAEGMTPDNLHVAGAHEISTTQIPLAALRYPPRPNRSRLVAAYPDPTPSDPMLNEHPADPAAEAILAGLAQKRTQLAAKPQKSPPSPP